MPEVEVRTIREAEDAGVGVGMGMGTSVGVGVGMEFGVDTDEDVVEGVLAEGVEVLLELDFWAVVMEELEEVEVVAAPPSIMLLKALATPPKGSSLGPDSEPDDPVLPEVGSSFPPSKFPNPSLRVSCASMRSRR